MRQRVVVAVVLHATAVNAYLLPITAVAHRRHVTRVAGHGSHYRNAAGLHRKALAVPQQGVQWRHTKTGEIVKAVKTGDLRKR